MFPCFLDWLYHGKRSHRGVVTNWHPHGTPISPRFQSWIYWDSKTKPSLFKDTLNCHTFIHFSHIGAWNVAFLPIQLSPRNRFFASHSQHMLLDQAKSVLRNSWPVTDQDVNHQGQNLHGGRIKDDRTTAHVAYIILYRPPLSFYESQLPSGNQTWRAGKWTIHKRFFY